LSRCATANPADATRCACGYDWLADSTDHGGDGAPLPPLRRLAGAGLRLAASSLKFKLFQALMIALLLAVIACGVGFLEARGPVARTLFAVGFFAAFGLAAVAITWLREKLT
jgi:hypothetical protein